MDDSCPQPRSTSLNASSSDQRRLLDLQALDTRIDQIAHRRSALPQHAHVTALQGRLDQLRDEVVVAETAQTDIGRELVKAEGDVELVRQRVSRDQGRLDSGQGSAKDLQSTQHELVSLAKRQGELEDLELEVMERLETATARTDELKSERATVMSDLELTVVDRDAAIAQLDGESGEAKTARDTLSADLPADLVTLYEKIRASSSGVGAARLHQHRCEGCHMELNPTDLQRISSAAPDEVLRCEDCRRILVRVPESGL
jgi:predicted  nucleic acid-binding Zn-ribbon protein